MTDVELVIKIPEEAYRLLKNEGVDWLGAEHILNAVANGTPLPKGHGRLKDIDWIDNNCEDYYSDTGEGWCYLWRDMNNAPTIIKSDKGVTHGI